MRKKKIKIPESIRIAGVEYTVREQAHLNDGANLAYGFINFETSEILLTSTIPISHQRKCITLLHEILHGIREANGLEIAEEEDIVDMFAKGLYQVLQDNGGRLFDLAEKEVEKDVD